jgi:hypothetical protein
MHALDRPRRDRAQVRAVARRPPGRRGGQPFTAGAVGVFLAAFGFGVVLSAFDRPS